MEWTRQTFREELGKELEDLFDDFSLQPIASGSELTLCSSADRQLLAGGSGSC